MHETFSEPRKREIQEEFKRRRGRQIALAIPLVPLILLRPWLRTHPPESMPWIGPIVGDAALLVCIVAALVFSLMNWRCPSCNGYLGRSISPRFCSKCGVQLT